MSLSFSSSVKSKWVKFKKYEQTWETYGVTSTFQMTLS